MSTGNAVSRIINGYDNAVVSVQLFDNNKQLLVVNAGDGTTLWNFPGSSIIQTLVDPSNPSDLVMDARFTEDGRIITVGQGGFKVWGVNGQGIPLHLTPSSEVLWSLDSFNSIFLFSGSNGTLGSFSC